MKIRCLYLMNHTGSQRELSEEWYSKNLRFGIRSEAILELCCEQFTCSRTRSCLSLQIPFESTTVAKTVCWSIDKMVGWLSIYWVVLERVPSQHTQLNAIRINTVTENLDHFPNSLVQMWNRERICCSFEFVCYFSVCNL